MSEAFVRSRQGTDGQTGRAHPPLPDPLEVPVYDNHTHLEIADGDSPLPWDEALDRAASVGVRGVVQVGTDLEASRWGAELAARDERVLAAVALHPNEAPRLAERRELDEHIAGIAELVALPRVRAVGETGLDYFRTEGDRALQAQRRSFEEHIAIAREYGLALQIHDRDAHADIPVVIDHVGRPDRVVLHCFSGDASFAELAVERGWYLSFAGTVTFKNAAPLRDALRLVPLSRILVETDAPFLTPTPHRGKPNSAYLIPHTVRFMAGFLEIPVAELSARIAANTESVYGSWSDPS